MTPGTEQTANPGTTVAGGCKTCPGFSTWIDSLGFVGEFEPGDDPYIGATQRFTFRTLSPKGSWGSQVQVTEENSDWELLPQLEDDKIEYTAFGGRSIVSCGKGASLSFDCSVKYPVEEGMSLFRFANFTFPLRYRNKLTGEIKRHSVRSQTGTATVQGKLINFESRELLAPGTTMPNVEAPMGYQTKAEGIPAGTYLGRPNSFAEMDLQMGDKTETVRFANFGPYIYKFDSKGNAYYWAGSPNPNNINIFESSYSVAMGSFLVLAPDPKGQRVVVADLTNHRILAFNAVLPGLPVEVIIQNNGELKSNGDGLPAKQANTLWPYGLAVAEDRSIFFSEAFMGKIRKIGPDGMVSTVAGVGIGNGYSPDGTPATSALVSQPMSLAIDQNSQRIYYAEWGNKLVRYIENGRIYTAAGKLQDFPQNYSGDGPALETFLAGPASIALKQNPSRLFIADGTVGDYKTVLPQARVLSLDLQSGNLTTFAGRGLTGHSKDGTPALQATFKSLAGIFPHPNGLYVVDREDLRVRTVTKDAGGINVESFVLGTFAGWDPARPEGREPNINETVLSNIGGMATIPDAYNPGKVLKAFTEPLLNRIGFVNAVGLTQFLGGGNESEGYTPDQIIPDGVNYRDLKFRKPHGILFENGHTIIFTEVGNHLIRRFDFDKRKLSTIAGTTPSSALVVPPGGFSGDGGPAELARLNSPKGIARSSTHLYVADYGNHRVRKIAYSNFIPNQVHTISTVAGSGEADANGGDYGDEGPALDAILVGPNAVEVNNDSLFVLHDYGMKSRLRWVNPNDKTIHTLMGGLYRNGEGKDYNLKKAPEYTPGFDVQLKDAQALAHIDGNLLVADSGYNRVLAVRLNLVTTDVRERAQVISFAGGRTSTDQTTDCALNIANQETTPNGAPNSFQVSLAQVCISNVTALAISSTCDMTSIGGKGQSTLVTLGMNIESSAVFGTKNVEDNPGYIVESKFPCFFTMDHMENEIGGDVGHQ